MSNSSRGVLTILVFFQLAAVQQAVAQVDQPTDTSYWHSGLKAILTFNQAAFKNWQAGGENTISANARLQVPLNYVKNKIDWNNLLKVNYGFTNQRSQGFRKTGDLLSFESNFGFHTNPQREKWLWTASVNFATQFSDGFEYPDDSTKISTFMAPGYLLVDLGIQFKEGDKFNVIYSPLASKWTFVLDDSLSSVGAFGVTPGQRVRDEFGTTLNANYTNEIIKNVRVQSKLILFTNYEENFGNIDVYWTNLFIFRINNVLAATLSLDFIYDDDILIQEKDDNGNITGEGPRLQYKQEFGLGITINVGAMDK